MRRVLFSLLVLATPLRAVQAQIAVVVNAANGEDELSVDRLRRLFLGQSTTFHGGGHARIATHAGSSPSFDRVALGVSPEIVRSRWLAMAFRGETTTQPANFDSADDVKRFVRDHPDAVAFLPVGSVDASVKVLRIDGRRPSDAGYLIR